MFKIYQIEGKKMTIRVLVAIVFAVWLSGCVETPDAEGWSSAQKSEFMKILKEDKYASICNQQPLYSKVEQSRNSKLMSKLLVAYAKNLANGCIDLQSFKAIQEAKREKEIETHYEVYMQKVTKSDIMRKLRAGWSIEQILKPYVPEYEQFFHLIRRYHLLKADNNTSILHKIRLNIERVKLMKPGLGSEYVLINIPEFLVRIIKDKNTTLAMAVVVGKRELQTPIFSSQLSYITVNPQWNIPDSIVKKSIIPKILQNPNYLKRNNIVIRTSYDLDSQEVSLDAIDWEKFIDMEEEVPYKFIQKPSKKNDLGRVKFIFPNKHAVYMHDTQAKNLFKRKVRCFSHGCVRLSRPITMLKYITIHYTDESYETVKQWYESLKTHHFRLHKRLPVHTIYLTTYMDESGNLLLFDDVYGFDRYQKLNFE